MKCNPSRWIWGLIPIAMLSWATFYRERAPVEADLTERAQEALTAAGQSWAKVSVLGRDAVITGRAKKDGQPKIALDAVRGVWGIRSAQLKTDLAGGPASPAAVGPATDPQFAREAARRKKQEEAAAAAALKARQEEAARVLKAKQEAETAARRAREQAEAQRAREAAERRAAEEARIAAQAKAAADAEAARVRAARDAEARAAQKAKQEADMAAEAKADADAARRRAQAEVEASRQRYVDEMAQMERLRREGRRADDLRAKPAAEAAKLASRREADAAAKKSKEDASKAAKAKADAEASAAKRQADAKAAQKAKDDAAKAAEVKAAQAKAAQAKADADARAKTAKIVAEAEARLARKTTDETRACEKRLTAAASEGVILFERAKADIDPKSSLTIARLAEIIKSCPAVRVEVEGHTDNEGEPDRNQRLSERRARAVMKSLAFAGVPENRLSAVGLGAERPIASNGTAEGMARNRRIEFKVFTD